jgi:hypothetical protein
MSQPGIVGVAGNVTGFEVFVPKAGDQQKGGKQQDTGSVIPKKSDGCAKLHNGGNFTTDEVTVQAFDD